MDTNTSRLTPKNTSADELCAWLSAVVDSSGDAVIGTTTDHVIVLWNRGAERLYGFTAPEAVGQDVFLIIPDDQRAEAEKMLARLRSGELIDRFETVGRTKHCRRRLISLTMAPVTDDHGNIIGASTIARDIAFQQERDELRARLAAIVQSSDDAIVSKTLDGIITSWNSGAERLFGYTPAEAIGQQIFLIIPSDRKVEEEDVLARLRRGERIDHFETVRQTKDGRRIPISLTVSPIRDDQGKIIGASKVARDISERLQAQEALRRANDQLEDRVRQRTAELRDEMDKRQRVEQERIQLLTRLVLAEEDERRRIARDLHDQIGQQMTALRLTLEALKVASVERTDLRVQVETLQELAQQLDEDIAFRVKGLRSTAVENRGLAAALREYVSNWSAHFRIPVQLHTSLSAEEHLPPETETMMYRLVQEALNNIIKHARAERVDIALERSSQFASLIIEDNGVGFDSSDLARTGEHFGLIGMRERAALVGADLQIESTIGRGTTVIVRAPVGAATAKP